MPAAPAKSAPLVVATVGTDHHPFDRLVGWIDDWLATRRSQDIRCLVQRGTSSPPRHAPSVDYLTYDALESALAEAQAVVCHGGPGTIMLCVAAGRRPIVVPRRRHLGEHVDDHQLRFTRHIADNGVISVAETQETFELLLDRELKRPRAVAAPLRESVTETVDRFEVLVSDLLRRPSGARR